MALEPISMNSDQRMEFRDNENRDVVVVSGYAAYAPLPGDENEDLYKEHKVEAMVGPRWREVDDASPLMLRAGLDHPCSDEDDASGYHISECSWDLVEDPAFPGKRIRIKAVLGVRGENAKVTRLAYRLTAKGARMPGDLDSPP